MKIRQLSIVCLLLIGVASCVPKKYMPKNYMVERQPTFSYTSFEIPETKIQKDDILAIQVISESTSPEIDALYNQPVAPGILGGQVGNRVLGYQVDKEGFLELPKIGKIKVVGMVKAELEAEIKKRLQNQLENPMVIARFQNFRVSVLGAVAREGVVNVPNERITIWEAISLAGGISDFGYREHVEVIREIDGKREVGLINLVSDSLFTSPYYYLRQNDVVLVKSNFRRVWSNEQANTTRTMSLIIALTSLAATLYNIFSK